MSYTDDWWKKQWDRVHSSLWVICFLLAIIASGVWAIALRMAHV